MQGSPPCPGGHSAAVSVSPRRSLPAFVFVVGFDDAACGPEAATAASAPAVKTAAPSAIVTRAFLTVGS
jgi:hypothetical protein